MTRPRVLCGAGGRPLPRYTRGPEVAKFFERNLRHVQGPLARTPVVLEPWQCDDLNLIYECDADGNRVWQKVLWGQARGNGKTPIVGGISLRELTFFRDNPRVFAVAGKRGQAQLIQEFTRPQVEPGMPLSDFCRPRVGGVLAPRWGGVLRVLGADGDLEHGLNVSFSGMDELHVYKTTKQVELANAIDTALKRPHSWRVGITTAGKSLSTFLGFMYSALLKRASELFVSEDGVLTIAANREARTLMIWRGVPVDADAGDESLWRAANPASWVDMAYLRTQAMTLPAGVFKRLHLNQWAEGDDAAISGALWDSCADRGAAAIPPGRDVFLAAAMSEKVDSGVLCAVGRPGDSGRRPVQFVVVPPVGDGSSVADVMADAVRAAAKHWRVQSFAFNPLHLDREARELGREGVPLFRAEGASEPGFREVDDLMGPASRDLLSALANGELAHDGDSDVREQIVAAVAETRRNVWRIARPKHVDLGDLDTEDEPDRGEAAVAAAVALACATAPEAAHPWAEAW